MGVLRRAWPVMGAGLALAVAVPAAAGAEASAVAAPPRVLADGSRPPVLPPALRRFEGRPVVGARRIARPAVPRWCEPAARPGRRVAWLSPEGLSVVYGGRRAPPRACDSVRVAGSWRRCSVGIARSSDPRAVERAGGALGLCRAGGGWRAFVWIRSSPRAAWALVRRPGYWLAYPAAADVLIRISGAEGVRGGDSFRARVVFVDARGRAVERRTVVGAVAG